MGLADDLFEVAPIIRLVTQAALGVFVGAALTWQGGWGADVVPLTVLAVLAVPLLVNATNLVDNADGLASTLSALSGLSLAAIAAVVGASDGVSIGLVLAAAGIGFLLYNSPPARVFMGDVGSLPFGLGIAVASLLVVDEAVVAGAWSVVLAIPAAWAVQLGDLGMVFITRINRGTSPFRGGVDHTSHRLMKAGLSPRQTLAALAAAAGVAGLLGVWSASSGQPALAAAVAIGLGAAVICLETWLVRNVPMTPRELRWPQRRARACRAKPSVNGREGHDHWRRGFRRLAPGRLAREGRRRGCHRG